MFIGNSVKDDDLALTAQETVNWYIESQKEGARNSKALIGAQGTSEWTTVGTGVIRAILNHNETFYVISGISLYRVASDKTVTLLGTFDENNQPYISANLTQIIVVNGVSGYVWDEVTEIFTKISDGDFYPSSTVCYQDGYLIFGREGTGQFFISNVDDALTYDAINFDEATLRGDIIKAVVSDTRNLWLFGTRTMEPWTNSGQTTGVPFTPLRGAASLRGTAAGRSVVSSQLGIFFLGDDHNVYWLNGYTPKNISTDAQAKELTGYADLSDAFGFMMNIDGHWFYVLTLPTQKRTFVYDPDEDAWHNRESYQLGYWRASCYESIFGINIVGDSESNKLGQLSRSVYQEYGGHWVARRVSGVFAAKNKLVSANRLELTFPSGQVPQNITHQARLRWSDNKGLTYGNPMIKTIGTAGAGNQRLVWWSMGSFRQRTYELSISTAANRDLIDEDFQYEVGGL